MGALMLCLFLSDCITQASNTKKEYTILAFSQFFQRGKIYCCTEVLLLRRGGCSFKELPPPPIGESQQYFCCCPPQLHENASSSCSFCSDSYSFCKGRNLSGSEMTIIFKYVENKNKFDFDAVRLHLNDRF